MRQLISYLGEFEPHVLPSGISPLSIERSHCTCKALRRETLHHTLFPSVLAQALTGFAWRLYALAFELAPPKEIAIVGEDAPPLLDLVFGEYRPNQVVTYTPAPTQDSAIPFLGDRPQIGSKGTAYVCWSAVFRAVGAGKTCTPKFLRVRCR